MDRQEIKRIAKERKCVVADLFVLAAQNDPFYIGSDTQIEQAKWWADVFHSHCEPGMHIRGCHYAILHLKLKRPDGKIYSNTKRHYEEFETWSKFARHLELVDPLDITDRRTAGLQNGIFEPKPDPGHEVDWGTSFPRLQSPELASVNAVGYEGDIQPYHLEVWTEKNDRSEQLLRICEEYEAVLQIGQGYATITGAVNLLERVKRADKPARIFYITDYDPAGENMPRALSRNIEFYNDGLDIKVYPLMLTKEQIKKYDLPSMSDESVKVEINAFTTLHPKEFDKTLRDALDKYYDKEIRMAVSRSKVKYQKMLNSEVKEIKADMPEIAEFYSDYWNLTQDFTERQEELKERFLDIEANYEEQIHFLCVEAPEIPTGKQVDNESPSLYDSELDYFEQLERYKK